MADDLIHMARLCNYVHWRKVRTSTGKQRLWWLAFYHRLFLRMQARLKEEDEL
jgi:hypothetical protein